MRTVERSRGSKRKTGKVREGISWMKLSLVQWNPPRPCPHQCKGASLLPDAPLPGMPREDLEAKLLKLLLLRAQGKNKKGKDC